MKGSKVAGVFPCSLLACYYQAFIWIQGQGLYLAQKLEEPTMSQVRKAVMPAAGMGTRFLPATKAIPKAMLPIVDKPIIQYVVEEAVESGFENIAFITSRGQSAIENHFDYDSHLEQYLLQQCKPELVEMINELPQKISFTFVTQEQPLGLGHAVLVAQSFVGEETFGVFLGDDIVLSEVPCMRQLLDAYETCQASVLAVQEVPPESVSRYGVVAVESAGDSKNCIFKVLDAIEKPNAEEAPSNLAIIGRYVLTPSIFPALMKTVPGSGGEIQLTDAIQQLLQEEPVYACQFKGCRYDAGNKLEYLKATVEFALQHKDLQGDFRNYLKQLKV